MELNHLKYFYVVAKHQSFTKASKELRVSQPSISKIVRQLEEREGVRLLDRAKRSEVRLTEVGKIFYSSCDHIFREIANLKTRLSLQNDECIGDLLVGASDNICNYVLPRVLRSYRVEYPKVNL